MPGFDFSPQTAEDLKEIIRYTKERWRIEQARRYRQEMELGLQKLSLSPALGRARDEMSPAIRSSRIGSHVAFYKTQKTKIVVIRLLHSNMDVDKAFNRQTDTSKKREL